MLPAAFVFCFGGKFVFGGRAFACTAGFLPRFGGSSVAGHPALLRTNKLTVIDTSVGDAVPYKQFVGSSQFFNMQWGQVSAGSGDPALPNVLCSITHYNKMLRRERS